MSWFRDKWTPGWTIKFDIKSRNWWIWMKFGRGGEFDVLNLVVNLEF